MNWLFERISHLILSMLLWVGVGLAAILLATILIGCSSWCHPYKGASDFEQDQHICDGLAMMQSGGNGFIYGSQFSRCMKNRGWGHECREK